VIDVESQFHKYAVSQTGARGYMQVMPFWVDLIGSAEHNLFSLRTNLRYGCTILRHYLDIERGDMARALARYNGSLGKTSDYAVRVLRAARTRWGWSGQPVKEVSFPPGNRPLRYLGESK
jgi:soluble lytic murein transglycosylase-like protein